MKKRILSLFLAIVMLTGMLPVHVFAAEGTEPTQTVETSVPTEAKDTPSGSEPEETEETTVPSETEETTEETYAVAPIDDTESDPESTSLDTSDLDFQIENPAGWVTVSFRDNGIRPEGASILDEELYGTAVGMIIEETEVPYVTGDSVADVTVRLLDAMGLEYDHTGTAADGFYLAALKDFELNGKYYPTFGEFDAGNQSGWCVRVNNWHINQGSSAVEVEDGDVISWLYTCQYGADIGADFSSKSAEITEVVLTDSSLALTEGETEGTYTCQVSADISAIAFEVMLENYASIVTVTVDGNAVKYRPNKSISVTKDSSIVIYSELEYMDAANNNEVTVYKDSVTIQLQEKPANRAPTVSENAPTSLDAIVGEDITVVLSGLFTDADDDTLTYHIQCEALDIDQAVEGAVFKGTISEAGSYVFTVTASDSVESVSHTVTLNVSERANSAPTVAEGAPTVLEAVAGDEIEVDLSKIFADADGDELVYNVKIASLNLDQTLEGAVFTGTIPTAGTYEVYLTANDGTESVHHTITLTVSEKVNHAPAIKTDYAETNGATYIYSSSYVYIYMDDIFEDADGDALTYKATLNGEEVEVTYNSWSKEYYIQFATKPAVYEYKIVANDGQADSEVFTAKCIGTSATITPTEDAPLIPGGSYLYYVVGTAENDTFAMEYTLDVNEEITTEWTSSNPSVLTANGDGTFTVGEVTSRQQLYVGVTAGKDSWGSPLYLGTKSIYILPAMPEVADVTAELAEHADNQTATVVSNAFTGWYSSEFDYEIADPSICSLATYGTYGLSVTPKALGSTTVTATFKYDESIKCSFTVTVTGLSLQIKDQPDSDDVIYEEGKTVQLEVLGAEEGETFTWTSADASVATVDENGLVTIHALGQTYITAVSSLSTEEVSLKASMYLQVKEAGKVYLDDLAMTDYSYFDGFISAKSGFHSAQLTYDWNLNESRYTYNKLAFTPYFDSENLSAVLHYQVSGGEYQTMDLSDGTAVSITNGLNPGENVVKIAVFPKDDADNITTYTFHIFRPYNPSNTISRMTIYPNGDTALSYPTYLDNKEGTIYQWDTEANDFVAGWNGKPSTGWSSSKYTYKTFIFGSRTSTITIYPTFAYVGQRAMIYVDGEELEEAVTNWESKAITIPVDGAVITLHVNSEKYHAQQTAAGVEDPFAEPERIYTIYVESVEPLGINSKILSAELENGEFYAPGFTSSSYTISGLIPSGETTTNLTFTVPADIDVYKTSVSDANKLTAVQQDEDGSNIYSTPIVTITGTGMYAYSTTNIILQVTDEEGNVGKTQYAFTVSQRGAKNVYPDSVVEYLCLGSQYTNLSSYGTMPERTLKSGGGTLSLGNFGGYIIYKYDTPIENAPNNPYGVDFVIYGNSFGSGGHEPGYVQVSQDGSTWYTLAGSEHYEDHNDWGFSMTYTNNGGKSAWTNSDGESGEIYSYPVPSAYPYFSWTEALEQSMTVSGPRLNSSAKDAYGSAAAVLPTFGYVDVNTNGTINGTAVNPYNHPGALASGGDQFDLSWAVDENGMPVSLGSISYIRIATASSIYAGAIGEKSTEVSAVTRVTSAAETAVGVTDAPAAVTVNGTEITVPENGGTLTVDVTTEDLTVAVTAAEAANIYIGNTGGAARSYAAIPEKGIIRIIVQEGEKAPYICYLTINTKSETDKKAADEVIAKINAIGTVTLDSEELINAAREAYDALTDEQKALVTNYTVLVEAEEVLELLKRPVSDIEKIYKTTGDYLAALSTPTVNSINGEWRVIGLARSAREVAEGYYSNVVSYVQSNINQKEQLNSYKSTDNSRVILALTAIGKDVTDVGGHNLLEGLTGMSYVTYQGINGPIWALLAFDSHDYTIPSGDVTREKLIQAILDAQLSDGGWALSGTASDPDMTGMALQALAPYYSTNPSVKAAVDIALSWLSSTQRSDGSFAGADGVSAESLAQVITALTALGINPEEDARFIKNGLSPLDALAEFYVEGGGFKHILSGNLDMMATEQSYYALVSYYRLLKGKTSLYDMTDVTLESQAIADVESLINAIGTPVTIDSREKIEAARNAYDALPDSQRKQVDNYEVLTNAEKTYADLVRTAEDEAAADAVEAKIAAIGTVTLDSEEQIMAARKAFDALTTVQKSLVENYAELEAAEVALKTLKDKDAAAAVEKLIAAIGNNITTGSKSAITAARKAYDALTDDQKELVSNYQTLVNAEAKLAELNSTISVSITLLGCYKHGSGETSVHTLAGGNLQTWISKTTIKVSVGATVKDVLEKVLTAAGMRWSNPTGNYVESINGIGEFTNGKNSGWMYTLNGTHPNLGVAQQTVVNGDVIVFHYTDDYTKEESSQGYQNYSDKEAAKAVEKLIQDIGEEITLDSEAKIAAAREAYERLTEEQKKLVDNYEDLVAAEKALTELKNAVSEEIYKTTGDYLETLGTPSVGTVGGEWMVIGLARSGRDVPDAYYDNVVEYVNVNINENEQLHANKSTDNSRLILALTAIGKDVTDVDGHDLLKGLADMDYVCKQGINGPIWALIAFDSGNYPVPEGSVSREKLIEIILAAQLDDGGWALSGKTSDPDMTGMAVQALAPYCETNGKVRKAVEEAVWAMSGMQNDNGSYSSVDGPSSESIAQVITALSALGIDADTDARFLKNGISAFDALLAYYVEGGGFRHILNGKLDGMATEQAYYAMTAYYRMQDEKTALYDMTDVIDMGGDVEAEPEETTAPTEAVEEDAQGSNGMWLWTILMIVCAGAVVVVFLNRKRLFNI